MNLLKKIPLAKQLYALVAIILLVMGSLIGYSLYQLNRSSKVLDFTVKNRMQPAQDLSDISASIIAIKDLAGHVKSELVKPDQAVERIAKERDSSYKLWNAYMGTEMGKEEAGLAKAAGQVVDQFVGANGKGTELIDRIKRGQIQDLATYRDEQLKPVVDKAVELLDGLQAFQLKQAYLDNEQGASDYRATMKFESMAIIAGLLISIGTALLIIRSTMRTLGADPQVASGIASRIAAGDLLFEVSATQGSQESLMGRLRTMKDNLLNSRLDYEGQIKSISNVQAVVEYKPDGTITAANENFQKITGYGAEELKGKHEQVLVDAAQRDSSEFRGLWDSLSRGQTQSGQFRRVSKTGKEVWLQGIYSPIVGVDGKPFKVVQYVTDITEARSAAALNAAFKGALDKVGANVIVANNEFEVIYMNESGGRLINGIQHDLRKDLPSLDASRLVGSTLDVLSKSPTQQRQLYTQLSGTHSEESVIGGRTVRITANPMKDDTGRRLGTVMEWQDRTAEVQTEIEVQGMVQAVTDGELSNRISLDGKTGFFANLSEGLNGLVGTINSVVKDVRSLVESANSGDLTKRIPVDGVPGLQVKIGSGINDLTDKMATVISQVKESALEVNRGADEISQGNANLSQRTEEQASSLEETASSMEEMTSTVKQNAENAGQANQLAIAARDQAEKGGVVVAKAVRAMTEINDSSKKIADIIGVIDEIAFQTNLLALNAAVEAARAGEQGRGFAVVATEVRNLAGRSATAAKEIKTLIQDSVKKVDEGSGLVTQSGATLGEIVAAVKKVTDIVAEISAASQEQSAGIEQVNKAVMQLDELTQQNAALVEEASAASQSMADQARGLNELMAGYKVAAHAQAATVSKAAAPQQAAAPAAGERRKSASRPWSGAKPAAVASVPRQKAAGGDGVWSEF